MQGTKRGSLRSRLQRGAGRFSTEARGGQRDRGPFKGRRVFQKKKQWKEADTAPPTWGAVCPRIKRGGVRRERKKGSVSIKKKRPRSRARKGRGSGAGIESEPYLARARVKRLAQKNAGKPLVFEVEGWGQDQKHSNKAGPKKIHSDAGKK